MKENIEELKNYLKDINEAIKVYEEFRRFKNDDFIESIDPDFFFNLTDIILSDYKRIQEEFKQVDHECERLEQKELRLEKEVELAKEVLKKQCDIADERNQLLIENQKLQKENEELKSSNEKLERANKCYINSIHSIVPVLNQDYIEKQKIKDKIEELKNKSGGNVFHIQQTINAEIRLLQDLLEEKGE